MNLLGLLKIEAIKHHKNMNKLIELSGVSRDTFYKKLRKEDKEFYLKIIKLLEK